MGKLPKAVSVSSLTSYQLGLVLMLWVQMGNTTEYKEENLRSLHQNCEVVWKKRFEENFVPFLVNTNLCNRTHMVLFLKILSSQYISSTLTQLK